MRERRFDSGFFKEGVPGKGSQEDFGRYMDRMHKEGRKIGPVTTEPADWVEQLQDPPEVVNSIAAETLEIQTDKLLSAMQAGDKDKTEIAISNMKRLLAVLERNISKAE